MRRPFRALSALAPLALLPWLAGCALPVLLDDESMERLKGKMVLMYVGSTDEIQAECEKVGTTGPLLRGCTVLQPTPEKARAAAERFLEAGGQLDAVIFSTPNETVIRHEIHRASGGWRGYPAMLF